MKPRTPRIILVEDDPIVRRMYERALGLGGFDVTPAPDGTILFEESQLRAPDIILMDVKMPNFNGLETLQELGTNVATRGIPVVMFSAYDDPEIIHKAMDLGAKRYLLKSQYEPAQVVDILKQVMAERQAEIDRADQATA